MKNHTRIIPRDFFNESKLLKMLGHFHLKAMKNPNDGALSVLNYTVRVDDEELQLYIPYNTKDEWPLMGIWKAEEYYMFTNKGKTMPSFMDIKLDND